MSTSVSPRSAAVTVHPTRQQLDELDALLQRMLDLPVNGAAEEPAEAVPPPPEPTAQEPSPPAATPTESSASDPRKEAEPAEVGQDGGDPEGWVPLRSSWEPSPQTWGPLARQWQQARQAGQTAPNTSKQAESPEESHEEEKQEEVVAGTESTPAPMERPVPPPENAETEGKAEGRKDGTQTDVSAGSGEMPTSWQMDAHAAQEALAPLPSLKDLLPPLSSPPAAEKQAEPESSAIEPPLPLWLWPFSAITTAFDGCLTLLGPLGKPLRSRPAKNFLGILGLMCLTIAGLLAAIDWFGWTW